MTGLAHLYLSSTSLSGTLPESVGQMTGLSRLGLDTTSLSGTLPESVGEMTGLWMLSLSTTRLSGTLPESVGEMTALTNLYLYSTSLSGTLPESSGEMTELSNLVLYSTSLSGTLPESVGEMTGLSLLYLYSTSLSGTLPESVGQMTGLTDLELYSTSLSGTLPESVGQMTGLSLLYLHYTSLSGTLPESVGEMTGLSELVLHYSSLSGTLPESVGDMTGLSRLYLSSTSLSGTLPKSVGEMTGLSDLLLDTTSLSGTLPKKVGEMTGLSRLYLHHTSLSGSLPRSVGEMTGLSELWLSSMSLSGTLPESVGQMTGLSKLYLDTTSLSGTLPESVGQMTGLSQLWLYSTSLSGTLPESVGQMTGLSRLYLQSTSLSGTLPESVGEMTALVALDAHSTFLSGVGDISQSLSLRSLRLSNTLISFLPPLLPSSLTHLYLDENPINASAGELAALVARLPQLHALSISVVSIPIALDDASPFCVLDYCHGTRVTAPPGCRVGDDCSWMLQLVDVDEEPALTGSLIADLHIGYNCSCDARGLYPRYSCEHSQPMVDNRDGTFTGTVPSSGWVSTQGTHSFRFYHGDEEFRPDVDHSFRPRGYDTLRTVNFGPIDCTNRPYSEPDSTGSTCVCKTNFTQNSHGDCYRSCGNGTIMVDGSACQCPRNTYDVRHAGVIVCTTQDWTVGDKVYSSEIATLTRDDSDSVCLKCPEECASCSDGVANLSEGWRLNGTDLSEIGALLRDAAFRPQFAYRCPSAAYNDATCPPMLLDARFNPTSDARCRWNHTGALCAVCDQGFSRRKSDGSCKRCSDSSVFQDHFGLSRKQFAAVVLAAALLLGGSIYWQRDGLKRAKQRISTMLKIALGLSQVLALLKDVLNLVFPPAPRHTMSYAAMFTADLNALYEFDCNGWDWYNKWLLTVVFLPSTGIVLVGIRYVWQRWHKRDPDAQSNATASLFLVVLLLYPRVSSTILSALRCRGLGEHMQVLEVDYSVDCLSLRYQWYRTVAFVSLALWPIGIPLGLLGLLWKNRRVNMKQFQTFSSGADHGAPHSNGMNVVNDGLSAAQYSKVQLMQRYAFCLNDYRPEAWWFEPADMLRKLALSGLLQFVDRGTASQVLVGCCISFASFGVHVRLLPYCEAEANVLKLCAEAVLFLTFLTSFILRVLPRVEAYEPVGAEAYGYLLVSAFGVFAALFFGLVARQTYRRRHFQLGLLEFAPGFESDTGGQEMSILTRGTSHQPESTGAGYTNLDAIDPDLEPEPEPDSPQTVRLSGSV
eukprot:COSAG03_NODE_226_length_10318_cov_14.007925_2_plen_1266_part_00